MWTPYIAVAIGVIAAIGIALIWLWIDQQENKKTQPVDIRPPETYWMLLKEPEES